MTYILTEYQLYCLFSQGYDPEQFAGSSIPILVIGSKLDLAQEVRDIALQRSSSIAEECGADEIKLVRLSSCRLIMFMLTIIMKCVYCLYTRHCIMFSLIFHL